MDKKIFLQDEYGKEVVGDILTELLVDDDRYVVYSIDKDIDKSDLYVSKIIQDNDGNDIVVSIDDDTLKEKVFLIVNNMINRD